MYPRIQLFSSSSFWIPDFSALRSDRTHSRPGILSLDATHASGGVIIFVSQGLSFSELSTFSLSSFELYSDYEGVNISLNNSSSLLFLKVYTLAIRSSSKDSRTGRQMLSRSLVREYACPPNTYDRQKPNMPKR